MNTKQKLGIVLRNPTIVFRQLNKHWNRFATGEFYPHGIDVFDEDWDNLILLDACRYDLFEETADLPGELSAADSKGTDTIQFLKGNLTGRELLDTVYVTANPQFHKITDELDCEFHAVVDCWREDWDDAVQTVLPETTASAALEAAVEYPEKRLFVHFNQPHVPFIGEHGSELFDIEEIIDHSLPFWQQPMAGAWDASDEDICEAYKENLQMALPHVQKLLIALEGRSVVTADHGNMIGERGTPIPVREYGHPRWVYSDELVTVPWLVHQNGARKTITAEAGDISNVGTARVQQRLEALGYK